MPSPLRSKAGIVAPVIAAAVLRPVEVAGADILHLVAVVDEGVAGDLVAFGAGREMHADLAAFEPVVAKPVLVGVVDEDAFLRPDARAICERRWLPVFRPGNPCSRASLPRIPGLAHRSAACRRPRTPLPVISEPLAKLNSSPWSRSPSEMLSRHHQPVRVHDGKADRVADRDVVADLAVVGVHVVDREAQIAEAVALKRLLLAGDREDAVAAEADVVVENLGARRVPHRDAVAGLVDPPLPEPDDLVVARNRVGAPCR